MDFWNRNIRLENESNGSHIAALKYALCKNAEQNNADVNIDDLKDIGPAEVCCYADPVRYIIPDRWYDDKMQIQNLIRVQQMIIL